MGRQIRFALLLAAIAIFLGSAPEARVLSTAEIMSLVNQDRAEAGLPQLNPNPVLNLAALAKAQDMFANNYFAHTSPEGVAPWHWFKILGYNYTYAGENLAEGFRDAAELQASWMQSPSHRANILSPNYSEMGLAVVSRNNTNVVVQLFGSRDAKVTLQR